MFFKCKYCNIFVTIYTDRRDKLYEIVCDVCGTNYDEEGNELE